jgi:hypothetical protein
MRQPDAVQFDAVHLSTDVTLHYAERGDRTGEAIIFLHAYVDSWFTFSQMLPLLSHPSTMPSRQTSAGTGTQISPNAATRWTTTSPMLARSWKR